MPPGRGVWGPEAGSTHGAGTDDLVKRIRGRERVVAGGGMPAVRFQAVFTSDKVRHA